MTMAKGLSSGYAPIAAAIVRDSVYDVFKENRRRRHSGTCSTFGGHPVACAAALQEPRDLRARESGRAERREGQLPRSPGSRNCAPIPTVGDVRGLGLMCGIDLVKNKETRESWGKTRAVHRAAGRAGLQRGLVTRVWDVMHFAPPLVTSEAEIDRMVEIADESLTIAEREFAFEINA